METKPTLPLALRLLIPTVAILLMGAMIGYKSGIISEEAAYAEEPVVLPVTRTSDLRGAYPFYLSHLNPKSSRPPEPRIISYESSLIGSSKSAEVVDMNLFITRSPRIFQPDPEGWLDSVAATLMYDQAAVDVDMTTADWVSVMKQRMKMKRHMAQ